MTNKKTCWHGGWGALLLVVATGAQAQTDYSAYGVLDFSYGRFEPSGFYREHRFNSTSMTASFVGVNLKHGLDDGWTPGITLETFLRVQDAKTGRRNDDPLLSRKAFVSLASNYGTFSVGRLQAFLFGATARFNALGNSVSFSPALRHVFASGRLDGVDGDFYWDHAVSYSSPNLEGVTANVMYAEGSADERGDYAGARVIVSRGLFAIALSAQRVQVNDGIEDPTSETTSQVGATYNFGVARIFGQYTDTRDRGQEVHSKIGSAGATIPFGPGDILAQFAVTTTDGPAVDRKHTTFSTAYVYPYDSVMDIYVVGMDDRIRRQTRGVSVAAGVRIRF